MKHFVSSKLYPVSIRQSGENKLILYVSEVKDLATLGEIHKELFQLKEYDWFPLDTIETVIDLGAHIGDTAQYYYHKLPHATVVAVEPEIKNIEKINRALKHINRSHIKLVTGAVGPTSGDVVLNVTRSSLGSSLLNRDKIEYSIKVTQKTLDEIFKEADITTPADLIKFDIEGAEFELFSSIKPEQYGRAYIGELHFDFDETRSLEEFRRYFKEFKTEVIPVVGADKRYMFKAVIN